MRYDDWTRDQLVAEIEAMVETIERLAAAEKERDRLRALHAAVYEFFDDWDETGEASNSLGASVEDCLRDLEHGSALVGNYQMNIAELEAKVALMHEYLDACVQVAVAIDPDGSAEVPPVAENLAYGVTALLVHRDRLRTAIRAMRRYDMRTEAGREELATAIDAAIDVAEEKQ